MVEVIENVNRGSQSSVLPATERARLEPEKQAYQDRVLDALARYEKTKSRKTKTVDRGKGEP